MAGDWVSFWFYNKVHLDPEMKSHPLVVRSIEDKGDTSSVKVED